MRTHSQAPKREDGVMLLEALIAILIFSIGILAVVGLQAVSIKNVTDSKHRTEAAFLANNLLAQMWTDAGNIASYAYPGSGGVPTRLTGWVGRVNARLPAAAVPPIVTITGASATGATVSIQVRWQLPEEQSQGLPPHNYTVIASVYTS
ncbi:MAG: type IV pilus modification protein PilV [Betaproteobacteria bacterium]|nr:MAG: type IV pilus modification protein PilV [Betaproteobacteria bacterium]TMI04499.1 MAG: type IV pilus modification protein PilV [Betaproteobacteria bacterium]TMI08104.1 MAG: type IV pilus modification protein PilV [Betaproteobacteria bacterium]